MMFFSNKLKFKKQSESLGLHLNDKQIKKSKNKLLQLTKKHEEVDKSLKKKQKQLIINKNNLISEHNMLLEQKKKHRQRILKLQVRRDQLRAKQNQYLYGQKCNILKKYLKCMPYTVGKKYQTIKSMKNQRTYSFVKVKILNLQLKRLTKQIMKSVIYMKKIPFQDQHIIFQIKQIDSLGNNRKAKQSDFLQSRTTLKSIFNRSKSKSKSKFCNTQDFAHQNPKFQFRIYAVTGEAFQIIRIYTERELEGFINKISTERKTINIQTMQKMKSPYLQVNKKHRLSLQYNDVLKKGLQGFFNRRMSQAGSLNQSKIVNLQKLIQQNVQLNVPVSVDTQKSNQSGQLSNQDENSVGSCTSGLPQNRQQLTDRTYSQKEQQTKKQADQNKKQSQRVSESVVEPASGFLNILMHRQSILIPDFNPLLNIIIFKKTKKIFFLPEYLQSKENFNKIQFCVRKYQFKINLQKQLKKCLLYRIIKIDRFFQTDNNVIQPLSIQVLFTVKCVKDQIYIQNIQKIKENLKINPQITHVDPKLRTSELFSFNYRNKTYNNEDIVVSCENIKCQSHEKTFLVHKVLREQIIIPIKDNNLSLLSNLNGINGGRLKPRYTVKKKNKEKNLQQSQQTNQKNKSKQRVSSSLTKDKKQTNHKNQKQDKQLLLKQVQQLFEQFLETNILSLKEYRFLKIIDFNRQIRKVIIIQKNMKCSYYKKLYKKRQKKQIIFKYQAAKNILISAFLQSEKKCINIYCQCITLQLNQKYKSYPITYDQKYWPTISTAIVNIKKLSQSIIQVKDQLAKYLNKKIKIYQIDHAKLELLKPQLYLNRLRRFFINIMLRVKAKRNIIYIKKKKHNGETYVLIIRKSQMLKKVCQANLYHLQQASQIHQSKQNLVQQTPRNQVNTSEQIQTVIKIKKQKTKNFSYQTIFMQTQYFNCMQCQKIAEQFYFDNKYFLLKPAKTAKIHYIQRLQSIDINCEQISKQLTMIQFQQPSNKKKTLFYSHINSIVLVSKQQIYPYKQNQESKNFNQRKLMAKQSLVKKNNSSIKVLQDEKSQLGYKNIGQTSSFRISQRSNTLLKDQFNKNQTIQQTNEQVSNNRLGNQLNQQHMKQKNSQIQLDVEPSKRNHIRIKGNGHQKIVYYSLLKSQEVFFELHIYTISRKYIQPQSKNRTVRSYKPNKQILKNDEQKQIDQEQILIEKQKQKRKPFQDELVLMHKQPIVKKQLIQANWSIVYKKIARWLKSNQELII